MNPFRQTRADTAAELGETLLIEAIRQWLGDASPPAPHGIGDDCAVFTLGNQSQALVTTDPVLWGRHFDQTIAPGDVAKKLFKRNLSDIAAMGGRPRVAVVSLLLPPFTSLEWLRDFHLGLRDASRHYHVPLVGGDVSQTDGLLGACMTLIGEAAGDRILTRQGASRGDHIFVTGRLGGSRLRHHYDFEPRLAEGQWLAARAEITAGMDISDGLAKDLISLIPRDCVAELHPEAIPLSEDAVEAAATSGRSALHHALCDGEDHELLITVKKEAHLDEFLLRWNQTFALPLTRIGFLSERASDDETLLLRGLPSDMSEIHGYEHLR
jgi:thiamine-monophosphate kinase